MQQHPIPQHVTGYKFHLVGNMTLKQFAELAIGLVLAWIIFSSNLFFLLKWTLGPIATFLGFALAFLPVEDRPLDQWIINFIKSIYSPTQFIYKSSPKTLNIFSPSKTTDKVSVTNTNQAQPSQLQDYLSSLPRSKATIFDQSEKKYLNYIKNLFGVLGETFSVKTKSPNIQIVPIVKSNIKGVRVRKLHHPKMCRLPHAIAPIKQTTVAAIPNKIKKTPPVQKPVTIIKKATPPPKTKQNIPVKPPSKSKPISAKTSPISFADNIIMPQQQKKPNLISGVTLDKVNKIIPNVIIEIRDSQGLPVRALKANKLGQFFIATPLSDGVYQIVPEHPNQSFDIIKLEAKGEIIPPIKIQSK
ncbi:MAG: PrgI family protein [Patescibacteria group bacterium]|nr:PrgI family protein [Patescibacteria group bacterium]